MRAALAQLAVFAVPLVLGAQTPEATQAPDVLERADSLYFAGKLDDVVALCDSAVKHDAASASLHWRAARAAVAAGMLLASRNDRIAWFDRALVHARAGLALAPDDVDTRYWVAAAAGRRADKHDPVYSARLALEVYQQATAILEQDSTHAGAHHAIGMLHAEATRLPRLVRFLASRALRVDFAAHASVSEAARHLQRAVDLEPASIQFNADLAELMARMDRTTEAAQLLQRVTRLPARHPMDDTVRRACLSRLQRSSEEP